MPSFEVGDRALRRYENSVYDVPIIIIEVNESTVTAVPDLGDKFHENANSFMKVFSANPRDVRFIYDAKSLKDLTPSPFLGATKLIKI